MKHIHLTMLRMAVIGGFLWSGTAHAEITVDPSPDGTSFVATVTDLANLEFITPNPSQFFVNRSRAAGYIAHLCGAVKIIGDEACNVLREALDRNVKPEELKLAIKDGERSVPLTAPLYSLQEWFHLYHDRPTLMVNANWFNVQYPPHPDVYNGYPYIMPVTSTLGYAVSDGTTVTQADLQDTANHCLFDALVVARNTNTVQIVPNAQIQHLTGIKEAVSGIIIVKDKQYVAPQGHAAQCNGTGGSKPRTVVGLVKGSAAQKLIIMVMQGRGKGIQDSAIAEQMIKKGVDDAINLDNSGSSQFLYAPAGVITAKSKPGDTFERQDTDRPVPNFFGIVQKQHQ
jgi:hypothetical protein